ncbi:thioredoxin family protein [Schlesneria paludicola]|uniref:thioredoxin family protein n=1 Tax=Schlesneria paludicola TaxID=360056 RepID=UPI00029B22BD|nr:thioredoxin domain-containing protein [Schlesneria paludicola]
MHSVRQACTQVLIGIAVAFGIALCGLNRSNSSSGSVNIMIGAGGNETVQATIYSAEWCGPCRGYVADVERELPPDGWIVKRANATDAKSAHVLIQKDDATFAAVGVHSIPCTIIRRNGKEVKRIQGRITPDALATAINTERAKP